MSLSYIPEQLKQYCQMLDYGEKQDLCKMIKVEDIGRLKRLSELTVAVEKITERELLEQFDDDHAFKEVSIAVYPPLIQY